MAPNVQKNVIKRINRKTEDGSNWEPSNSSHICNLHYENYQGPTRKYPQVFPTIFKKASFQPTTKKRRLLQRSILTEPEGDSDEESGGESDIEPMEFATTLDDVPETPQPDPGNIPGPSQEAAVNSSAVQIDLLKKELQDLKSNLFIVQKELDVLRNTPQRLDIKFFSANQVQEYTGVSSLVFGTLLVWLGPAINSFRPISAITPRPTGSTSQMYGKAHLSESQKLLLVLIRIRLSLTQEDLAFRFCVEQSTVSRILTQWIPMLAANLGDLIKWPQTTIGPTLPPYDQMPNLVGIVDATEIFIQRPSKLGTQKSSYSEYKSHNTVKYLVCIDTFTGAITYVSPGFSGNSSDRFVVEKSGFLDKLVPGQRILADRGFTARDLLAKRRAFLTIPSFLRSQRKLTSQQAMETRKIASVRIKVENAIKLIKDFKVFQHIQPNRSNRKLLDDMVTVACALVNLQKQLIT